MSGRIAVVTLSGMRDHCAQTILCSTSSGQCRGCGSRRMHGNVVLQSINRYDFVFCRGNLGSAHGIRSLLVTRCARGIFQNAICRPENLILKPSRADTDPDCISCLSIPSEPTEGSIYMWLRCYYVDTFNSMSRSCKGLDPVIRQ